MKSMLSAAALAVVALCASAPASADILIRFSPATSHIAIGGSVNVEMNISGLGDEILSAFDINLLFNNAIVQNFSVTHNVATQWPGGGEFGPSDFGVGNTEVIDYSLNPSDDDIAAVQLDAFTVLTFGFTGLADGSTTIGLGPNLDFERSFVGRNAGSLTVDVGSACIAVGTGECGQVQPAPEPASYGLAAIALLAAGVAGRRRRSPAAA